MPHLLSKHFSGLLVFLCKFHLPPKVSCLPLPLVPTGTKCSSSQGCSLNPIKQLLPFWSPEGPWRSFRDQPAAAADTGEEVAQSEDCGFKGAPHMGFLSEDKVSFHRCQISRRMWTHDTALCMHTHLYSVQTPEGPCFFWC